MLPYLCISNMSNEALYQVLSQGTSEFLVSTTQTYATFTIIQYHVSETHKWVAAMVGYSDLCRITRGLQEVLVAPGFINCVCFAAHRYSQGFKSLSLSAKSFQLRVLSWASFQYFWLKFITYCFCTLSLNFWSKSNIRRVLMTNISMLFPGKGFIEVKLWLDKRW